MRSALVLAAAISICRAEKDEDEPAEGTSAAQAAADHKDEAEAGGESEANADGASKKNKKKGKKKKAAKQEPDAPGLDAALAFGIEQVDNEFVIDPFVATLVAQTVTEAGDTYFERAKEDKGFRVKKVKDGSLLHLLGLRNGDIVTRVGSATPPGEKRLEKLLRKVEDEVNVTLTRDGAEVKLSYRLEGSQSWHAYLAKTVDRTFDDAEGEAQEEAEAQAQGKPTNASGAARPARPSSGSSSSSRPSSSGAPPSSSSGKPASSSGGWSGPIPVSCSSASSCTVGKAYFDKMVSSSSAMSSQAKIAGAPGGYKLTWVKPGSGVSKLQFRAGDVITRVNGRNLSNQLEALALYAGLKSTRTFRVNYQRGGRALSKTIHVK